MTKRQFQIDPGKHPKRLQRFLRTRMTAGVVPGRNIGNPAWWRLRDTKSEEFRANQRALGLCLLAATCIITVVLVLHASGNVVRIAGDGVVIVGAIWVLTAAGGVFLLRKRKGAR